MTGEGGKQNLLLAAEVVATVRSPKLQERIPHPGRRAGVGPPQLLSDGQRLMMVPGQRLEGSRAFHR